MIETMQVKISGTEVYKAVKNYLNNNEQVKQLIDQQVANYVAQGLLTAVIERLIKERLAGYYQPELKQVLAKLVDAESKNLIKESIEAAIKKTLSESVFVVPKVNGQG